MTKEKLLYLLLDSRAGMLAIAGDTVNMEDVDDDWGRFILVAYANPKSICRDANSGDYGENCIVADTTGHIYWEWFDKDGWKPKKSEK